MAESQLRTTSKIQWYFIATFFVLVAVLLYASVKENNKNILTVAVLDIGQGDAIFIESPNGNQMLIDGGPPKKVLKALSDVMPFYDRSIDTLLVTNPDKDHTAGFIDVLKTYKVNSAVEPGTKQSSSVYSAFRNLLDQKNIKTIYPKSGDVFVLDKKRNIILEILFPDRDIRGVSRNTGSIVAKLSYGDTCFIFPGDAPQSVELYLVELYKDYIDCDVLKVGHHGSKTSSSPEFVNSISPKYAAISSGEGNAYGHPHEETLETFLKYKVEILRTDQLGAIIFQSDGRSVFLGD